MGSGKAVRLELGVEVEKRVLAKNGSREDIVLVYDERPDLFDGFADQIIETAQIIRGDRDSFRLTDEEVVIEIPALPRPTPEELQAKYSWIKRIERDDSPTEAVTLRLGTVLKSTEKDGIDGKIYERRLIPLRGRTLGYQQREWIFKHQLEFPALMALLGKVYVDFSGIIVVHVGGRRGVPCARQRGERWVGSWYSLGSGCNSDGRVAVSDKAA